MITSNTFLTTQEYRIYPNAEQRELINQTLDYLSQVNSESILDLLRKHLEKELVDAI